LSMAAQCAMLGSSAICRCMSMGPVEVVLISVLVGVALVAAVFLGLIFLPARGLGNDRSRIH